MQAEVSIMLKEIMHRPSWNVLLLFGQWNILEHIYYINHLTSLLIMLHFNGYLINLIHLENLCDGLFESWSLIIIFDIEKEKFIQTLMRYLEFQFKNFDKQRKFI